MAETPPTWLNNKFLEQALRSGGIEPNVTVTSCEIKRAALAGDHYGSEMYRATLKTKVNGKTEEISVIVKCKLRVGELSKMTEDMDIYIREARTFTDVHNPMRNLLKSASPEYFQPFAAKCIYTNTAPEAIVLEDLKKEGFKLATATHGLDLKHCLLVMRTIAQYHASSMILIRQDPSRFEAFMGDVFSENFVSGMRKTMESVLRSLREEVKKWPGYERFPDMLASLQITGMDHWVEAVLRDETGINVLIHGDLWLNNMMFRYSEENEEVKDVRFVDFQLSYVTSPAVDLQYFMNSSASPEVLENDRHVLIDEYYNTLCETLSKLGHADLQFSKDYLNAEFEKKGILGAILGVSCRAFVMADRNHLPDMDNIMKNNSSVHLSNPFKETVKKVLPLYEKWGWLKV